MAKHSFFGGSAEGLISGTTFATAGYNLFGLFDSSESVAAYIATDSNVAAVINTPSLTATGTSDVPINNAQAGSGIVSGDGGSAASTQAASFMGGVNNGLELGGSGKRYYYIGCINYNNYNLSTVTAANKLDGNNVDGMYQVDENAQYTTAGDVGGSGTDYTVCLLSNNKNGQSTAARQGTRITFRFANSALASGLSQLAYYSVSGEEFNFPIVNTMTDEQAAGRWLALGYGLLKGGQPAFWDNAN